MSQDAILVDVLRKTGRLSEERAKELLAGLEAKPDARLSELLTEAEAVALGAPRPPPPTKMFERPRMIEPSVPLSERSEPKGTAVSERSRSDEVAKASESNGPPDNQPRGMVSAPPPSAFNEPKSTDTAIRRREKVLRRLGRFDLHEEMGTGGAGTVYRATDNAFKNLVAVRILPRGDGGASDIPARFHRAAKLAMGVKHENIAAILDVGEADDERFVAMERIDGVSLETLLLLQGALPPRVALEIARDAARGLGAAHAAGVVHWDVKPGNILLERAAPGEPGAVTGENGAAWRVKVSDFGLARGADGADASPGAPVGTAAYLSPEQALGRIAKVDARSDVYSLGCVLYRMLTGVQPYPGSALDELLPHIRTSEPEPVTSRRPGLQRDIGVLVSTAMAREPALRYPDGLAMASDLDRWLRGETVRGVPAPFTKRFRRAVRRNLAAVAALALCAASLAAAFGWTAWQGREQARIQRETASAHLSRAKTALDQRQWEVAEAEFQKALDIERTLEAEQGLDSAQLQKLKAAVRVLLDQRKWEGAQSVLALESRWRSDAEIQELTRLALGRGSLAVDADDKALDVDYVEAEPGVTWDEETFPPLDKAREAGLTAPRGAPETRAPGEWIVVWSRAGKVERLVAVEVPRGGSARAEYRVRRVGPGFYESVPAALKGALPGTVVEVPDGSQDAGWSLPPGVLLRPAPGAKPVLRAPEGSAAIFAEEGCGASVRDLEFAGGAECAVLANRTRRFTAARLRIHDFDKGGLWLNGGADAAVRDIRLDRALDQSIRLAGERHLAAFCSVTDAGWAGIALDGPACAAERCTLRGGQRVGIHALRHPGLVLRANDVSGFPDWGILLLGPSRATVTDNLCTGNAASSQRDDAANIAFIGGSSAPPGSADIRHNTTAGGGPGIVSRANPGAIADNLSASHAGPGLRVSGERPAILDYNLVWNCRPFGEFLDARAATLDEFKGLHPELNLGQMQRGIDAPPQFVDPDLGDFRLSENSPAHRAASDGSDIGARLDYLATLPQTSVGWLRRRAGEGWLKAGREALEGGKKIEALALLKKAAIVLEGEISLPDLIRRASE